MEQKTESNSDSHWHLDKRLNVGHILTTLNLEETVNQNGWCVAIRHRALSAGQTLTITGEIITKHHPSGEIDLIAATLADV